MHLRVPGLLAIVLFASGCGAVMRTGVVSQPTPIPWIATKPVSMLLPTPSPTPIPSGTQACQAGDLEAVFTGSGAATGGQLVGSIVFGNRTGMPCVLEGVPGIELFDAHGRQIPLAVSGTTDPPSRAVLIQPNTAEIQAQPDRAGRAWVMILWPTHDPATGTCSPAPPQGTILGFQLPGGAGSLRVPIVDPRNGVTVAACGGSLSVTPFQATAAPETTVPPDPLHSLSIQLDVPHSVAAGTTLHYTVSLLNAGVQPVAFPAECPVYGEWVPGFAKEFYVLNCGPVRAIQPGQTEKFAMELAIPRTTTPGGYVLYWNFTFGVDLKSPGKAAVTVIP
jgi:Protein of unknown function (DUF4232)